MMYADDVRWWCTLMTYADDVCICTYFTQCSKKNKRGNQV